MTLRARFALALLALAGLTVPAQATWSIVVLNTKTREVCVAGATCLAGMDLIRILPVVVVGEGGASAQSVSDDTGQNRLVIWNGILAGEEPARILDFLSKSDSIHKARQYGIVSMSGLPATHTGDNAGKANPDVSGIVGDWVYAIQGNVLAGDEVVFAARDALLSTDGDMITRVMAGMEAARAFGGDGRCSCSLSNPDGCGSPPPGTWKSAHCAFVVLARMGDVDGVCDKGPGCANGDYYLSRQVKGIEPDPDPVLVLADKVASWRLKQAGRPDHLKSEVSPDREILPADGKTTAEVRVTLRDIEGVQLSTGGATLTAEWVGDGSPTALPGAVVDHGDGTYTLPLQATAVAGRGAWHIWVDFGAVRPRLLWPPLVLPSAPPTDLFAGRKDYSVAEGGTIPFTIDRGVADAGRPYRLLASAAGSKPGFMLGGVLVPLNRDRFLEWTWNGAGPEFAGSFGVLDSDGRAEARLDLPIPAWQSLVGERLGFCAVLGPGPYDVTQAVSLRVVP